MNGNERNVTYLTIIISICVLLTYSTVEFESRWNVCWLSGHMDRTGYYNTVWYMLWKQYGLVPFLLVTNRFFLPFISYLDMKGRNLSFVFRGISIIIGWLYWAVVTYSLLRSSCMCGFLLSFLPARICWINDCCLFAWVNLVVINEESYYSKGDIGSFLFVLDFVETLWFEIN